MSRLALLDVFVGLWVACGVACLVADRDWARARFATAVDNVTGWGPVRGLLLRPWRIAAGVCFGAACGTKWSGLYALAAFAALSWVWDVRARRALGERRAWLRSAVVDGLPAFVSVVLVGAAVYLATWVGFLRHHTVYSDRFGHGNGDEPPWGAYLDSPATSWPGTWVDALRSLWNYHQMIYSFHTGEYLAEKTHPYGSQPRGWLLLNRPVGVDAQLDLPRSTPGCVAEPGDTCLRQVLILGNPVLWWAGAIALLVCVVLLIVQRDWRYTVPLLGVAAGWLPWLRFDDRPIFLFYATAFVPFTAMAVTLVFGAMLGPPGAARSPRRVVSAAVLLIVLAVQLAAFAFFWPIWTDELISRAEWEQRMWFDSWV
jgi:dolichyl-phosphate-mannose--protein O-mannosyl transferase